MLTGKHPKENSASGAVVGVEIAGLLYGIVGHLEIACRRAITRIHNCGLEHWFGEIFASAIALVGTGSS
jgi:hypothetical protein